MIAWGAILRVSPLIPGAYVSVHDSERLPEELRLLVRALLAAYDAAEAAAEVELAWRLRATEPLTWDAIAAFRLTIMRDVRVQITEASHRQDAAMSAHDDARERALYHGGDEWSDDAKAMLAACLTQLAALMYALACWHATEALLPTIGNMRTLVGSSSRAHVF